VPVSGDTSLTTLLAQSSFSPMNTSLAGIIGDAITDPPP
jgi:hypothetical protein